jgi:hypothetical protein
MSAELYFSVPDSVNIVRDRCLQAIRQLGAPLKSDSGHFITGVISSGHNNIELRVTWLPSGSGTQITVTAEHEGLEEYELQNAAMRFRNEYVSHTKTKSKRGGRSSFATVLILASAAAAVAVFVFSILHQGTH